VHQYAVRRASNGRQKSEFWIRKFAPGDHIADMSKKPLDLPMQVAKAFIKGMRAFHQTR
jgi:hypothetical protein